MRRTILMVVLLFFATTVVIVFYRPQWWFLVVLGGFLLAVCLYDMLQKEHAVRRNFPLIGNFRYMLEAIRPEIYQYFIESETDGKPFSREQRSVVYQRAKKVRDTVPFGTLRDVYEVGYEWANHSILPTHVNAESLRVKVGNKDCQRPYPASLLNISGMSFGSLSRAAVLALSQGAKIGNFAHNTGEGGVSPYHVEGGGDLIWQIGTGYFGCRDDNGNFDDGLFAETAAHPHVKMIELKLSQGAKPGHGGILPAAKLTREIADIRKVPMGRDVLSPPGHSVFSTPIELLEFIAKMRKLSGGKPTGFKLCLGKPYEFMAICKAMLETSIYPDYIAIDGGEGGTGAAPLEFSNHVGTPLMEALIFVHSSLTGFGLRDHVSIFSSGKITTGFEMIKRLAMGADVCYSARGMMLSLGCIQALRCNSNHCPVGIATQQESLIAGLVPSEKNKRVASFHEEMLHSFSELLGAMGLSDPSQLRPWHILRRTSPTEIQTYHEIYDFLEPGELLDKKIPPQYRRAFAAATASSFHAAHS